MSEVSADTPPPEPLGSWRVLVQSFGTLAVGEGVARLLGLVAVFWTARRLEPGGFGLITLGATLVAWFSLVVDSGTEVLKTRDISRHPHRLREIAEPVLGLRLVLSTGAAGVFALAALFATHRQADRNLLWLFALVLPARALNLRWMVLGVRASKAVAVGNVASQLVFAGGVFVLVSDKHDTSVVPILQAGGELAYALVVLAAVARRFGILRPRVDLGGWLATLRASLPLFVNAAARAAVYSFNIVLIAVILKRSDVGFYGAAYKPVLFFIGAAGLFFISFLASYSGASAEDASALLRRTIRISALITIPIALVLSATSSVVVTIVYGDAYAPAATSLAILSWMIPVLALAGPYGNVLIAGDRQGILMRNNLLSAAFSVAANAAVVPLAGIEGAAIVAVASQFLVLALSYRSAVGLKLAPPLGTLLRPRPSSAMETPR